MHLLYEVTPEASVDGTQVALAELERLCVEQHEDVVGLEEALATAQPASAADNQQRLAEHLAGPAIMRRMRGQHTDLPTTGRAAAVHPSLQLLQLPLLQQVVRTDAAPLPGGAPNQATQEESAHTTLTMSAALTAIDGMAGNETSGPTMRGPTPGLAGLPEQPAAAARKEGPYMEELSQPTTTVEQFFPAAATAAGLWCHEALARQGTGAEKHRPGKGKSRPPYAPDIPIRQTAVRKGRGCARKQRRPQAAQEAVSTAGSSGDAAVVGAASPGMRGGRALGKGKSRPPGQHRAAMNRQPAHKLPRRATSDQANAEETTSADAARARLQSWVQHGLPSLVSKRSAAAKAARAGRAPATRSAAPGKAAACKSKHQVRQPYVAALLAIPRQLALDNKQSIQASSHPNFVSPILLGTA